MYYFAKGERKMSKYKTLVAKIMLLSLLLFSCTAHSFSSVVLENSNAELQAPGLLPHRLPYSVAPNINNIFSYDRVLVSTDSTLVNRDTPLRLRLRVNSDAGNTASVLRSSVLQLRISPHAGGPSYAHDFRTGASTRFIEEFTIPVNHLPDGGYTLAFYVNYDGRQWYTASTNINIGNHAPQYGPGDAIACRYVPGLIERENTTVFYPGLGEISFLGGMRVGDVKGLGGSFLNVGRYVGINLWTQQGPNSQSPSNPICGPAAFINNPPLQSNGTYTCPAQATGTFAEWHPVTTGTGENVYTVHVYANHQLKGSLNSGPYDPNSAALNEFPKGVYRDGVFYDIQQIPYHQHGVTRSNVCIGGPQVQKPEVSDMTLWLLEDSSISSELQVVGGNSGDGAEFQITLPMPPEQGTVSLSGRTLTFTPAPNWFGYAGMNYRARLPGGDWSDIKTIIFAVVAVNDPPVAHDAHIETNEDQAGSTTLVATDIDSPPPEVFQILEQSPHGTASIVGNVLTFVPNPDWHGFTTVKYWAHDNEGAWSNVATVHITVHPVNDPPVAQDKTIVMLEDTSGSVALSATDIDSPVPTIFELVSGSIHGATTINGNTLTFTPNPDWNGSTSVTYRAQDNHGAWSMPATVSITVTPVNDPPIAHPKELVIDEDTIGYVSLSASDIDSPTPTVFQIVSPPSTLHGQASIEGSTLTFSPVKDWNGSTSLTYRAQDSSGAWSAPAVVSITVNPVNDPPVAINKALFTDEDVPGSVVLSANDVDSPAPSIFELVKLSDFGTSVIVGNRLTFTPNPDWNGSTLVTYRAQDSDGAWSEPATVFITVAPVNDPPVADDKTLTTQEDTRGVVTLTATDIDSPVPTIFEIVTHSVYGIAEIIGDQLTFMPSQDWHGTTSVTYRARDTDGAWSEPATVTIIVTPVNDPPVVLDQDMILEEDTIATLKLLVSDPDTGDSHVFTIVTEPNSDYGSVSLVGDEVTFVPRPDWNGNTSFTFRAQDSAGAYSNIATVRVTVIPVNDPPIAHSKELVIDEDTIGYVSLSASDIDSPTPTVFQIVSPPSTLHGQASIEGSTLTFSPVKDWNGSTSLTYRAQDSSGAWSAPAVVSITVNPVNDPPVAINKALFTDEDVPGSVVLSANDVDSPAPSIFELVKLSDFGTSVIVGNRLTFTPNPDWNGSTLVTYRAQDSDGAWSEPATVFITVAPVNDKPIAQDKSLTIDEDTVGTVTLTATDIDSPTPDVFELVSGTIHGVATVSGNILTFTPNQDWNGETSVTYRARDTAGAWSDPATIMITVIPVNDPPVAQSKTLSMLEDHSGSVTLSATDIDSPAPEVFELVSAPSLEHGVGTISGDTFTFVPTPDWNGETFATYRAQDNEGAWSEPARIDITVIPVNDPPIAQDKFLTILEDVPGVVTLTATDIDSPVPTVFAIVTDSPHGSSVIRGDKLTFTPSQDWNGETSLTYRAQDSSGAWSEPALVLITVIPVNDPPIVEGFSMTANRNAETFRTVVAIDPDEGDTHVFSVVSRPSNTGISVSFEDDQLKVVPVEHWHGTSVFTYRATDAGGLRSNIATVTVNIPLPNDTVAPRISLDDMQVCMREGTVSEMRFRIEDFDRGVDMDTLRLVADFDGELFDVPYVIKNPSDLSRDARQEVYPRTVIISPLLAKGSAIEERLHRAFQALQAEGGQAVFAFEVSVSDTAANSSSRRFEIDPLDVGDTVGPEIEISAADEEGFLRNISQITITATDDKTGIDAREIVASVRFDGEVYPLTFIANEATEPSRNACVSRHPLQVTYSSADSNIGEGDLFKAMATAFANGEQIDLEVSISDYALNTSTQTATFRFAPEIFKAQDVSVPGVKHQFRNRTNAQTVQIKAEDVALILDNELNYVAVLGETVDPVPVAINDMSLLPGEAVDVGTVSLRSNSTLGFDVRADGHQVEGDAVIYLIPSTGSGRVIEIPVHAWLPNIELNSPNWEPLQLFDRISVQATQTNEQACSITGSMPVAINSDKLNQPVCYLRWSAKPPETFDLIQSRPELSGYVPHAGEYEVGYEVVIHNNLSTPFVIQQGTAAMRVKPASQELNFTVTTQPNEIYRVVSEVDAYIRQSAGPSCSVLTTDLKIAQSYSKGNRPPCLISWDELPDGIEQSPLLSSTPYVGGHMLQDDGDGQILWSVSSISNYGTHVDLMSGHQIIPILNPPEPLIRLTPRDPITETLFASSMEGAFVADLLVETINAPSFVDIIEDGALLRRDGTATGFSDRVIYRSRLSTGQKSLWTITPYAIETFYANKPSHKSVAEFGVLAVPTDSVRPDVEVAETTVLNTEELQIDAFMRDVFKPQIPYSAETMGDWEVRLMSYLSFSRQDPITDFSEIDDDGRATFNISLENLDSTFLRVLPEARIISPVEEYERTSVGSRPLYITVLRGAAIDSNITARRLVGEAPLGLYATLNLADRLDAKAIGEIRWDVRRKGEGWSILLDNDTKGRLYHSFQAGEYEVRAMVTNKNSGAEFLTEIIEVHAYDQPDAKLLGPANIFVGASGNYKVEATHNGEPVSESDLVVQWSEDDGDTWQEGGLTYTLTRDVEERVTLQVKVRLTSSPADFDDANKVLKSRVSFRNIRPPRSAIYGPKVMEVDQEVEWRGLAQTPYRNMDVEVGGRFVMPDGTVVDEEYVQYLATQADSDLGRVPLKHEAWIVGFEDQGAVSETTKMISVWKYEWPEWEFYVRASTLQAPSEISVRMRNPGGSTRYLEQLTFDWDVPEGIRVTTDNRPDSRVFMAETPGTYPINVTISDGRGYVSEKQYVIDIIPPDPWEVDYRISSRGTEYRSPLSLRTIPVIRGGHPRDRIQAHRYYLNGELVADGVRYFGTELLEGDHELTLEMESQYGNTVSHTKTIEVLPNTPPTCALDARQTLSGWRFSADCNDVDGSIASHDWTVNGEVIGMKGGRISVTVRDNSVPRVTLSAVDNGGARSNTVIW